MARDRSSARVGLELLLRDDLPELGDDTLVRDAAQIEPLGSRAIVAGSSAISRRQDEHRAAAEALRGSSGGR